MARDWAGYTSQSGSKSLGLKMIQSTEWVSWKGPSSCFTKMVEVNVWGKRQKPGMSDVSQMSQMIGVTLSLSVPTASYRNTCWDELVLKKLSCRINGTQVCFFIFKFKCKTISHLSVGHRKKRRGGVVRKHHHFKNCSAKKWLKAEVIKWLCELKPLFSKYLRDHLLAGGWPPCSWISFKHKNVHYETLAFLTLCLVLVRAPSGPMSLPAPFPAQVLMLAIPHSPLPTSQPATPSLWWLCPSSALLMEW